MKVHQILESNDWDNLPEPHEDDIAAQKRNINKKIKAAKEEITFYRNIMFKLRQDGLDPKSLPRYNKIQVKERELAVRVEDLNKQAKQIQKAYREKQFANVQSVKVTQQDIDDAKKLDPIMVGNSKVKNPLNSYATSSQYAGPIESYPDLTGTQKDIYLEIKEALARNGKQPLTTLYGGRTHHGGINFLAFSDDHKFAWKKYEPDKGAGANDVYIIGVGKINTRAFVYNPDHYLKMMT